MKRFIVGLAAAVVLFGVGTARADFVFTHGPLGPHLDPFSFGWPLPAPAAGPGVVVPTAKYDVVGPGAFDVLAGFDAVVNPGGWHWEVELDLDPVVLFGGSVLMYVKPLDGPLVGPFTVPLIAGPDIYFDIHQMDVPETGVVLKALWNLTPIDIAWGTSVTEDPGLILAAANDVEKHFSFPGAADGDPDPDPIFETLPAGTDFNTWKISGDYSSGFTLTQADVPEPSTFAIWSLLGLCGIGFRWRRRRKA